ncbi:hypothetical protein JL193_07225 [Polaribacter batillariae]|uniref:PQ loop repeat-containing protein n=1 Tax=Polaribacter batillariae TaxID=2808900 RepID=A0ABX7T0H6_9FLAO|nr:hypothetical protein [Polaribacter batillariae]QTD39033.1 hypothetical protein JL193_07225 [Polaribacter batillariae]
MELLTKIFSEGVILSALGGLAYPLLTLLERIQQENAKKINLKDLSFYVSIGIYVFLASVVGYIYFNGKVDFGVNDRLLAVHVGITSPLLIRSLASAFPKQKLLNN